VRKYSFIMVLLFLSGFASGQNLLGYKPEQIKEYFELNDPGMILDKSFRNDTYKYLKFIDLEDELRTVLVFLSDKDRCKSVKAMYDLSLENEILEGLNKNYSKSDNNTWLDNSSKKKAVITYNKDDWFITVIYKPKK